MQQEKGKSSAVRAELFTFLILRNKKCSEFFQIVCIGHAVYAHEDRNRGAEASGDLTDRLMLAHGVCNERAAYGCSAGHNVQLFVIECVHIQYLPFTVFYPWDKGSPALYKERCWE